MADAIRGMYIRKPYTLGQKTIPIHTLEPKEPKITVSQNGYDVSRSVPTVGKRKQKGNVANSSQPHLLTSIGGCLMIHIPGSNAGTHVLAHLDPAIDNATALYRAMSHLIHEGIIDHPNGQASILTTPISSGGSVVDAFLTLRAMGFHPEVTQSIPLGGVAGINNEGQPVRFDFSDRSEYADLVKEVGVKRRNIGPAIKDRRLVYDNDNRFRAGFPSFEIYPKVPAFVYTEGSKSQPGAYGFNIPLDFELNEDKLHRVAGVRVERKQSEHGPYIHVGANEPAGQLQPKTIDKVQKVFYAIARQLAKRHP